MSRKRSDKEVAETLERLRREIAGTRNAGDPVTAGGDPPAPEYGDLPRRAIGKRRARASGRRPATGRSTADAARAPGTGEPASESNPAHSHPPAGTPVRTPGRKRSFPPRRGNDHPPSHLPAHAPAKEQTPPAAPGNNHPSAHTAHPLPTAIVTPAPPSHRPPAGGLRSKHVQATDEPAAATAVTELLRHRRRGRGKILGIAGLPRHGKTTLADRLRERAAERPGADLRYNKTERGDVNIYYIPGRRDHHVLIDMAGEDYQVLGSYDRELPQLMESFLWPVLQRVDGLALLMALPIVWSGWNDDDREDRRIPSPDEREEMRRAAERMLDAHRMLLKYAIVARNLGRLTRRLPELGLDRGRPPARDVVDDAFKRARGYDRPVSLLLSKADLYVGRNRRCLHTPNPPGIGHREPPGIRPGASDPLLVAAGHFPAFLEFLVRHVRYFKWSFCQALEDRSPYPDPLEARSAGADVSSLIGGEGMLDFLTRHPWSVAGISAGTAIRLDQRLRRGAWDAAMAGRASG